VSEERGEISLAVRGKLYRNLTPETLRGRLQAAILHKRWVLAEPGPAAEAER
jgi:hypothetical protein